MGGSVYFSAYAPTAGYQLWKTGGTAATTVMVTDINASPLGGLMPQDLKTMGGRFYFDGNDGLDGDQLWSSDGTAGGTSMVSNINSPYGALASNLAVEAGILYFTAYTPTTGYQLWESDGTASGTVMDSGVPAVNYTRPTYLVAVGGNIYFAAPDASMYAWQSGVSPPPTNPTISWRAPAPITYGMALSSTQLDATTDVPGTFSYDPPAGSVLNGGTQTLSVTFTPNDTIDYAAVTVSMPITIAKVTPTVSWASPTPITYGTALGDGLRPRDRRCPRELVLQPGHQHGSSSAGTVQTLTLTFTPDDAVDYNVVQLSTTIAVAKATPTVAWAPPTPITYGTALGDGQLDATVDVPGSWSYSPGIGTILGAGTQTLTLTFTPDDAVDYNVVQLSTTIAVAKATPTVQLGGSGGVYSGAPLPASVAFAGVGPGVDAVPASSLEGVSPVLTYYTGGDAIGTPISGASVTAGTYTVVATFPGSADYIGASAAPLTFTITPAATTVALGASTTATVFGQAVTLTANVASDTPGAGPPAGTVTFFNGGTALSTVALDASGQAVLTVDSLGPGAQTITAAYGGDSDRTGSQSGGVAVSVTPDASRIVLVPRVVLRKRKVVALSITAKVEPLVAGAGLPTGNITFLVKKKTLGRVALSGGQATIATKPARVIGKSITITYDGTAEFLPATATSPKQTAASLKTLARSGAITAT